MEPERARILVVDDDPAVRQTFQQMLEREGHEVDEAGTGTGGLEVLRELQGRERVGAVIIVTGHGNAAAGMEAARLGARAILEKPCPLGALGRSVREAIDRGREEQERDAVVRYIEREYWTIRTREDVAGALGVSVETVSLHVRQRTGLSFLDYLHGRKVAAAQRLLRETRETAAEIAYGLGFQTAQHFARVFREHAGQSPGEYRARAETPGNDAGGGAAARAIAGLGTDLQDQIHFSACGCPIGSCIVLGG